MKKSPLILLIVVVVMAGGIFYFFKDTIMQSFSHKAVEKERRLWQQKTETLEHEIAMLEEDLKSKQPDVSREKLVDIFGTIPQAVSSEQERTPEVIDAQVKKFFDYIDQKGYLKKYDFEDEASEHFKKIVETLEKSSPVISGETQDLYTLMKNITYFYRILGEKNAGLIRDIISQEGDILEPTMELFFLWLNPWGKHDEKPITISRETAYEYGAFFLNTIAGQSYLFRRDSKIRTLMRYYCVVVLDKANSDELNKYGIDIRPHIDAVMSDIKANSRLVLSRKYIEQLNSIKKKY